MHKESKRSSVGEDENVTVEAWNTLGRTIATMAREIGVTPEEAIHIWRSGLEAFRAFKKQADRVGCKEDEGFQTQQTLRK